MVLSTFLTLAIVLGAGYLIYRVAKRALTRVDVDDTLDKVDALNDNYDRVKDIDLDEVREKQKKVDEVIHQ